MPNHPNPERDVLTPVDGEFARKRCVVTGGLGFIGSNVVHRLCRSGASVIVVDSLVPQHGGDPSNLDGLTVGDDVDVVDADIGADEVGRALQGADFVFNVAGQVSHLASMQDPLRDLDLNVRSHLAFLETLRREAPTAVVVQTSTRQVYGRPRYLPVDEEHPTAPVDVNGVDKLACEQLHLLYSRHYECQSPCCGSRTSTGRGSTSSARTSASSRCSFGRR